jgi:hypothetical protein
MDVIRMEGCSDLVDVTVDETLGPCHDGLGLGALLGSGRHNLKERKDRGGWSSLRSQIRPNFSDILEGFRGITFRDWCHGRQGTFLVTWGNELCLIAEARDRQQPPSMVRYV